MPRYLWRENTYLILFLLVPALFVNVHTHIAQQASKWYDGEETNQRNAQRASAMACGQRVRMSTGDPFMPTKPICADIIMCSVHLFLFAQAFSLGLAKTGNDPYTRICHTRFCKRFIQLCVLCDAYQSHNLNHRDGGRLMMCLNSDGHSIWVGFGIWLNGWGWPCELYEVFMMMG